MLKETGDVRFKKVSVALHGLVPEDELRQLSLFTGSSHPATAPAASSAADLARREKRERLSAAMEATNRRFGREAVTLGGMPGTVKSFTGAKVAFSRVPERHDFEDWMEALLAPATPDALEEDSLEVD